jgi:hypothetical protein
VFLHQPRFTLLTNYTEWIASRQERMSAILKEAFEDKPKLLLTEGGSR